MRADCLEPTRGLLTPDARRCAGVGFDVDSIDNRDPEAIRRATEWLGPLLDRYFTPEVQGLDRVPPGAALYVGNHNGGLCSADTFILCQHLFHRWGLDAVPYGLGHDLAVKMPGLAHILVPLGAVRAGSGIAQRLFEQGRKVMVYPGGDLDSLRPYRDRNRVVFGGSQGYLRLALRAGVPLVPVVAAGAHATFVVLDDGRWLARGLGLDRMFRLKVWPITLALPWGLMVGTAPYLPLPTKICIEVLEPMHFERSGPEAAADEAYVAACDVEVRRVMQAALTRLAEQRGSRLERAGRRLRAALGALG